MKLVFDTNLKSNLFPIYEMQHADCTPPVQAGRRMHLHTSNTAHRQRKVEANKKEVKKKQVYSFGFSHLTHSSLYLKFTQLE
jgi:hypothetical protein